MIAVVDVKIQAENPAMPLWPMKAYVGSPSSIRVRNVPKKIGDWCINKVTFVVNYPDNTTQSVECKLVGGVYVGTIEGSSRAGTSANGYVVTADGVDENGNDVTGYILGKGDITIMDNTTELSALPEQYNVTLLSGEGTKSGDVFLSGDTYQIVNVDGTISALGGNSELPSNISCVNLSATRVQVNTPTNLIFRNPSTNLGSLLDAKEEKIMETDYQHIASLDEMGYHITLANKMCYIVYGYLVSNVFSLDASQIAGVGMTNVQLAVSNTTTQSLQFYVDVPEQYTYTGDELIVPSGHCAVIDIRAYSYIPYVFGEMRLY